MLPYINTPFELVAGKLGASTDELKLIFTFLLSYPLAGLLKRLPDDRSWLKNAFNIGIALFYLVGLFNLWSGVLLVAFDATVTYLIAIYVSGPYMPWLNFTFLMGHMGISHIRRQMADSPQLVDITGAQMVLVMKLSAFGWNVFDGQQKDRDLLSDAQKERMLTSLPSPLDYAGWVAFFPALMAGPAFDYIDYSRWLTGTMFALPPGTDPLKAAPTRKARKIPRSATPAMWKLGAGLAWIFAFLQLSKYHGPAQMLSPKVGSMNVVWRVWYLYMMNFTTRTKYYGVWTLTEGACILSGIGYRGLDPKTGKHNWDRLTNIRPLGVELGQNAHAYLGNWNCNTNHWLRNYIYLRVTPRGKKPGFRASMATFVTSAFWHGFMSGYYLTFVLASFMQNTAKNSRRLLRPFFMTPDGARPLPRKRYYDLATWVITQLAFCFCTSPFILLNIHDSMLAWARVYFYAIIGVIISSLFLLTPGKAYLQKQVKIYQGAKPGVGGRPVGMERAHSMTTEEVQRETLLGIPTEPGREWDELVDEVTAEMLKRRGDKKGPEGIELRDMVERQMKHGKAAEVLGLKKSE